MALFQQEIADAVDIPVFMSSMLQVPFITRTLKRGQKVGIISANASVMTDQHLRNVGITPDMPVVLYGMEGNTNSVPLFWKKRHMDTDVIEKEILEVCNQCSKTTPKWRLYSSNAVIFLPLLQQYTHTPDCLYLISHNDDKTRGVSFEPDKILRTGLPDVIEKLRL